MPNKSLTEILQAFDIANADGDASFEEVTEQAVAEILTLFRNLVPEERNVPPRWDGSKASWDTLLCDVWNDCRKELLESIDKLEKGD